MNMRIRIDAARLNEPVRLEDGSAEVSFRFPADDPTFAGHFPGRPLLPGVFELEMARAAAEWVLACPLEVREISRAKWTRPILPAETVRLELRWKEEGALIRAHARLSVEGQVAGDVRMELCRSA